MDIFNIMVVIVWYDWYILVIHVDLSIIPSHSNNPKPIICIQNENFLFVDKNDLSATKGILLEISTGIKKITNELSRVLEQFIIHNSITCRIAKLCF